MVFTTVRGSLREREDRQRKMEKPCHVIFKIIQSSEVVYRRRMFYR